MNQKTTQVQKETSLIHCTKCKGPLVKNVKTEEMDGSASFVMKCPHCGNECAVTITISKHPSVEIN